MVVSVSTNTVDTFLTNWNAFFTDMPLTMADLKKPQAVMTALWRGFDRLGIDREAVMMPFEEVDEHSQYYRDLMPLINTSRVYNQIMPNTDLSIPIMDLLQPTIMKSYTILVLLLNLIAFNESQLEDIAPMEQELTAYQDQVKLFTDKKDNLIQARNTEAAEKGKRKERLEQIENEIPKLEEELKREQEIEAEVQKELDAINEENRQADILLEQKRAQRDAILAENARKKALRVYDADDIRAQAEQAEQNVREAEEKLSALSTTLTAKESSLNNLQTLKPVLDQSNTLLHDIMRVSESIKDFESGDLDLDSLSGELSVLRTEMGELEAALAEARNGARAAGARRRERAATREQALAQAESTLREAEEKHQRSEDEATQAAAQTRKIKDDTLRYEQEKTAGVAELAAIKENAVKILIAMQDDLLNKMNDVSERMKKQSERRRN